MQKSLSSNGCAIAYDVSRREGAAAVALLHGYGVHRGMWQDQYRLLGREYTVLNIDVRGHGASRPCATFSIPEAADDLRSILVHEGVENAVLVGLSMGGYIVQEYAFQHGGASGYMLIGDTPMMLDCYTGLERVALRYSAAMFKPYPWNYLKKVMTNACVLGEAARARVRPMFDCMTKQEFIAFWNGIGRCLHTEQFQFDAPLLVACGDSDRTGTILKCMPEWEKQYQNCRTMVFPNAAHVANLDNPDAVNRAILSFVRACTAQDGSPPPPRGCACA